MNKAVALAGSLMLVALLVAPALATEDKGDDAWHFNLAPFYLWLANTKGDSAIGPVDQKVSVDFGDVVDTLEKGYTAQFEARKGSWGGIFNIMYMEIGDGEDLPDGSAVDVSVKNTLAEIDGFYSIRRNTHTFDALAGLRYTKQDTGIEFNPGPGDGVDEDWWDPIVGIRWGWNFAEKWQLVARGDIGGFGVGSDFTWNALGILIWQPWKNVHLGAGFRALDQDYEKGEGVDRYKWDATLLGPMMGVNFLW
jgi:hypothetical protein